MDLVDSVDMLAFEVDKLGCSEELNVSDEAAQGVSMPDVNVAIQARGPEFVIGQDIPRIWATGAQAFVNPDFTMLIFREQNLVGQPPDDLGIALKNVSSIVMPTPVARELYILLKTQLEPLDGAKAE